MRAFFKKPLVIATVVACLFGLLKLVQPIDHMYWNMRFRIASKPALQSVLLVSVGEGQGSKRTQINNDEIAKLLAALSRQAPNQIYFDLPVDFGEQTPLAQEIRGLGSKITVVARASSLDGPLDKAIRVPDKQIVGNARIVYSGWYENFVNFVTGAPGFVRVGDQTLTHLSADLSGTVPESGIFIPDFGVDPQSIPSISADKILASQIEPGLFTGRSVIVTKPPAVTDLQVGFFGHGRVSPVVVDVAGASSLASGSTYELGMVPSLLLFLAGAMIAVQISKRRLKIAAYSVTAVLTLFGPMVLQLFGFYVIPSTGITAMAIFVGMRLWSKWRRSVMHTSVSGLPNFMALTNSKVPEGHDLVVAVIGRYDEILATLPQHLHAECAHQVARRFAVGSGAEAIYQGEGGHFAWVEPRWPNEQHAEHFEGMRALFSAPLLIGGQIFDTNVHFGLDRNSQLDVLTRLNAASASANDALKAGRTIEQFEASRLADAPWELSLLARIDEGMKNGDIWLAYQPQWDYRSACVSGAEALVRWNDPTRGPIRPDAFIVQAEKAGRIDALTYWVFEEAITAAQAMKEIIPQFQMSINLSAQLVDKPSLLTSVSEIIRRRGVDCRQFTIEVTETAAVYNRPAAVQNLQQLRAMGFRLAIDDFGTGESSLLYLAELPSDELKIDQHFVSRILTGVREREIVNSTIKLAHALKQSIVAEGIEDRATFDLLARMGCDTGQGFFIGRPEGFDKFRQSCLNMQFREVGS